jgi:hypothetical protein
MGGTLVPRYDDPDSRQQRCHFGVVLFLIRDNGR